MIDTKKYKNNWRIHWPSVINDIHQEYSLGQIATMTGITKTAIASLQNGKNKDTSYVTGVNLLNLAKHLTGKNASCYRDDL